MGPGRGPSSRGDEGFAARRLRLMEGGLRNNLGLKDSGMDDVQKAVNGQSNPISGAERSRRVVGWPAFWDRTGVGRRVVPGLKCILRNGPLGVDLFRGSAGESRLLIGAMKRALMFSTPKTIFVGVVGLAASLTQLLAGDETAKVAVDEAAAAKAIHEHIVKSTTEKEPGDVKAYKENITGTGIGFEMVPIPGGEFTMGSADGEAGHQPDEGPQVKVKISPFWMGKFEVTWNEYELFMRPEIELDLRKKNPSEEYVNKLSDAITRPTKPYVEMSFGMGKDGFPAISMTQHAANKYCQWLSARTGHFYRLPTEAEWEYACRAGTTTAYSFGDDEAQLENFAWYGKNSDWKYQKVGKKKANPWGLHDIHGNVVEWTLDQYDADWFKKNAGKTLEDPWNRATKAYPHVVRGGSWDDEDAARLRSAARRASDKAWKIQDPQLPKSIWYHTDAQFLGMRVVRPLKVPAAEEMHKYWNNGVERE
ncbi:MAG: formylglycine-generating enzyme family protein [Verrucomicrobiales bacterium]|nr:formylglycine-generating enzyme family protein [Verrucomicrobiales bacterium]